MYEKFGKRLLDFCLAFTALLLLSPLLLVLTVLGAIAMRGNPFFVQPRAGRIRKKTGQEAIFPLLKFRTMSNARDSAGNLLPDAQRLNAYGKFLRSTSCDELPELVNILLGQMAIVGPRPLLVEYLPYYTPQERKRHTVRPGLTGLAQVNGRNSLTWEEIFQYDLEYVARVTFLGDVKILLGTVGKVLRRSDITVAPSDGSGKLDHQRSRTPAGTEKEL